MLFYIKFTFTTFLRNFQSYFTEKNTKIYTNRHEAFRALLGGIGTGNISLDNTGAFNDFEVLNHPDKGLKIPYTFFSLYYAEKNGENNRKINGFS